MTPRQREIRTSDHQGFSRRKPPTGTAAHRAAKPHIAKQEKARGRLGTPTSGRHSPPKAGGRDEPPTPARLPSQHPLHQPSRDAWSAGLRPASRGSAKPAPTTPRQREAVATSDHQGCSRWKPPTGTLAEGQRKRVHPITPEARAAPAEPQCSTSQRIGQSPVGIRTSTEREPAVNPVAGSRNRLPLASRQSGRPWP